MTDTFLHSMLYCANEQVNKCPKCLNKPAPSPFTAEMLYSLCEESMTFCSSCGTAIHAVPTKVCGQPGFYRVHSSVY